ncbi:hypothetical protein [Azotobacter beijerinckii]|uniref:hypothetical protein n=1 Tax=Azotobacter beijerinckii TaxID=170623 RepID=UPI002955ADB3|nr:hypothetical protein [Azotobacter beijerinckii]MDV7209945.1 hypothetical protein [Azotobacter beijerinckii]
MEQDKVRAEFEEAYRKARYVHVDGFDLRRLGDAYQCEHAQFAWDMWRASREALVVELPERYSAEFVERQPEHKRALFHAHNGAVHDCKLAIEAAGIRAK